MSRSWARTILAAVFLAATMAGAAAGAGVPRCSSSGAGQDSFCEVDGVRLHYVDWGGAGPDLILLAGFGDTARMFDELAPLLTADHRVIAFTRRGFGQSAQTPGRYSPATMAKDVSGLMDAIGVERADLVGHSVAGAEMLLVARAHPKKVGRLIYLDAAYDRSAALELEAGEPASRRPPDTALQTFERFAAWRGDTIGRASPAIVANLRQSYRMDEGGLRPVTPPSVLGEIAAGGIMTVPAQYEEVRAASLAIYTSKTEPEQLPPETPQALREASRLYTLRRVRPWMLREQARFLETAPCGVAVERQIGHYIHLVDPAWTARMIRAFLAAPEPCSWRPVD